MTTINLLLVEDLKVNQEVVVWLLEEFDVNISIANNGAEGLTFMAQQTFDLVLMDCSMPGMDGFQATRAIRQLQDPSKASIPIIAVTAYDDDITRNKCSLVGMNDFVARPFEKKTLVDAIERWTDGRLHNTVST